MNQPSVTPVRKPLRVPKPTPMPEVTIVGGGVCGLALAHSLQARRVPWQLVEARPRLGGRVLTERAPNGAALDLGATWFWPTSQPSVARLVTDLGLPTVLQADDGHVLLLDDPNQTPKRRVFDPAQGRLWADAAAPAQPGALHGGAKRLKDGMGALVTALSTALPASALHLGVQVRRLVWVAGEGAMAGAAAEVAADAGAHVRIEFAPDAQGQVPPPLRSRRVVLALPPRLAAEQIVFDPPLPPALREAMQATPTWMATAAKAAVPCAQAVGAREDLACGNAWVTHPQAVLAEVFAAGHPADILGPGAAAVAGFSAFSRSQRQQYQAGMAVLVDSQLQMLFGPELGPGPLRWHDWAQDTTTCSQQDLAEEAAAGAHPRYGDPALAQACWDGHLWLGGSETAALGGGYVEGALNAAARLRRQLAQALEDDASAAPAVPAATAVADPADGAVRAVGAAGTLAAGRPLAARSAASA